MEVEFFKLTSDLCSKDWLKPYAAFCFLRDFFETSDHSQWGHFSHYSKEKVTTLLVIPSLETVYYTY